MADYKFYTFTYMGGSIPADDFYRLAARAEEQLARYKRQYRVRTPDVDSEDKAICAMADALYYFENAQSGVVTSSSIGSVSSSAQASAVDVTPKAQARELYRCASQYLDFYRGCG